MTISLILIITLLAGLLVQRLSLPPLIGFLLAGFGINQIPAFQGVSFDIISHAGIILLLFTIGLKLDIRTLLRAQIAGTTTLHMATMMGLLALLLTALNGMGLALLTNTTLQEYFIIGFALSFSSTIFAVKALESRGEMEAPHGKVTIGILITQDIIAVAYLAFMGGQTPTVFAPLVLLLIPCSPLLNRLLIRSGHGELLVLAGFSLAFFGYYIFETVGLKGDIGALFMGALLANHAKAHELSKILLNFKELFLVGFFLSIGQYGLPENSGLLICLFLLALVLVKPILFFSLLSLFKTRSRTAFYASSALNNYSEFGLIIAAISISNGMLDPQWAVVIAISLALSFIVGAMLDSRVIPLYNRYYHHLNRLEHGSLAQHARIPLGDTEVMVCGLGRVGVGAYNELNQIYPGKLMGMDQNPKKIKCFREEGKNVLVADATECEMWDRLNLDQLNLVILALGNHSEILNVANILIERQFKGAIAAIAKYPDEERTLSSMGLITFNLYAEAGAGFANHIDSTLNKQPPS